MLQLQLINCFNSFTLSNFKFFGQDLILGVIWLSKGVVIGLGLNEKVLSFLFGSLLITGSSALILDKNSLSTSLKFGEGTSILLVFWYCSAVLFILVLRLLKSNWLDDGWKTSDCEDPPVNCGNIDWVAFPTELLPPPNALNPAVTASKNLP